MTFQEPDIVFGQIAGMAMSLPDELKEDDQEIKRPPIVGEWFVVSPTKVSKSKRKLLKALGFTIVDMTEWQKPVKNDPKMPKDRAENYMIAKSNISRMVASCLSGNYHEKPPNPRAIPDYGSQIKMNKIKLIITCSVNFKVITKVSLFHQCSDQ